MMNVGRWAARVAGIVILIGGGRLFAQDWPQWRGPDRDGKLSGFVPPQSWPKELTQKWKVTVGVGDSSPALVGNKLYTFGRQEADEVIRCIDAGSCLIALAVNGDLSFYLPSDKQYMERAHYKVGDPEIWAHPVVAGKNIFIRDKESVTLWAIE